MNPDPSNSQPAPPQPDQPGHTPADQHCPLQGQPLSIAAEGGPVKADLICPRAAEGLVIFCHGTGSDRHSPRNRAVAELLQNGGLATLLIDLDPPAAAINHGQLAALPLLSRRLLQVIDWLEQQKRLRDLPLALFGSSSGAAVALEAAAARPHRIAALVSRGGRPDLASACLTRVRCPILLIIGEHDVDVLELNAWAAAQLQVRHRLVVVPQAGHLFAEPGCLEAMGGLACRWLQQELKAAAGRAPASMPTAEADSSATSPAEHQPRPSAQCSRSAGFHPQRDAPCLY